jgi:uncharacterized protein YrrD
MLDKAKVLKGYGLESRDGEIGTVEEFYFDDKHWAVRYLVANTGNWLTGRQVLISPYALAAVSAEERHIAVDLTRKQIEESPALATDKPVSRQFEDAYYGYFGWPMYWGGPYVWGAGYYPLIMSDAGPGPESAQGVGPQGLQASPDVGTSPEASGRLARDEGTWDSHLRSTHDVISHHIQATDGEIGHVEDFIIDDKAWAIRYLIVDTKNWWPAKKVLVSPRWIERVSWSESKVFVNLTRETIKQAPEYVADAPITREYETKLYQHYQRPGYWVDETASAQDSR